jgi:hypothetical protein
MFKSSFIIMLTILQFLEWLTDGSIVRCIGGSRKRLINFRGGCENPAGTKAKVPQLPPIKSDIKMQDACINYHTLLQQINTFRFFAGGLKFISFM